MVIFCDFLFHGTGPLISFQPVLLEKSSVVLLGTLQEGEVSEWVLFIPTLMLDWTHEISNKRRSLSFDLWFLLEKT